MTAYIYYLPIYLNPSVVPIELYYNVSKNIRTNFRWPLLPMPTSDTIIGFVYTKRDRCQRPNRTPPDPPRAAAAVPRLAEGRYTDGKEWHNVGSQAIHVFLKVVHFILVE